MGVITVKQNVTKSCGIETREKRNVTEGWGESLGKRVLERLG